MPDDRNRDRAQRAFNALSPKAQQVMRDIFGLDGCFTLNRGTERLTIKVPGKHADLIHHARECECEIIALMRSARLARPN